MILLTGLQVTANVYASFKYMATSGSTDWTYWQKSILIGVQAQNAEMYQIIISWIAGALLPIVALGMTALVAQNIRIMREEQELAETPEKPRNIPDEEVEEIIENEVERRVQKVIPVIEEPIIYNPKETDEEINQLLDEEIETLIPEQIYVEETKESEVITEPPKKRGRPPRSNETVAVPKKRTGAPTKRGRKSSGKKKTIRKPSKT